MEAVKVWLPNNGTMERLLLGPRWWALSPRRRRPSTPSARARRRPRRMASRRPPLPLRELHGDPLDEKIQGFSVVVGGQRSKDGLAAVMVVPDRGGEGEEPLKDSDGDALWAVAAVLFQAELAFQG